MTEKVAVVGTGLVGAGWGIVFARGGCEVSLYDSADAAAAKAYGLIAEQVDMLDRAQLLREAPNAILGRVRVADSLSDAVAGAAYVQESVFERVDVKRQIFSEIDAVIGPETMVGSSSSGIAASLYTDHVGCRGRCLVAHPVNPPYLAPVVELVPAPWTDPATIRAVRRLMEAVGQAPVEMTQEIEGFILNRLQGVLLMEAWRLVEAGLATAADVDKTISKGLGLRWAFMGPFETIDLNAPDGVADYARRLGPLYQSIAASTQEHRAWDERLIERVEAQRRAVLPASQLDGRRVWRDRRLMGLVRYLRSEEESGR